MTREERIDRVIDALLAGDGAATSAAPAEADVSHAARLLVAFRSVPPSSGRADIRRTVLSQAPRARPARRLVRRLVVVSVTVMMLGGGVAMAARNATPGDALYPVRRGLAAARVAITFGDHAKAVALLDRAAGTLADAKRLAAEGHVSRARATLSIFARDLANARAEIAHLRGTERDTLKARAARLQAEATQLRASLGSKPSGDKSPAKPGAGSAPKPKPPADDPDAGKQPSPDEDEPDKPGKDESGKDESGKDESGKDKSGKDESGKEKSGKDKAKDPKADDDAEKAQKEAEKAEKERLREAGKSEREEAREAEKAEKERAKEAEKAEKERAKEAEKADKERAKEAEKAEKDGEPESG